jgi:chromate transport protein ChrA
MDKSVVVSFVDATIVILVFILGQYVSAGWVDVVKTLLLGLQPFIVALIVKLLGAEAYEKALRAYRGLR